MNLNEILKKSRSVRRFDSSRPVPDDDLYYIVSSLRYLPSTMNAQAIKYYISNTKSTNYFLRSATKWAAKLPDYDGPTQNENPTAYIVICLDTNINSSVELFKKDAGISAQAITMLCTEKDLGCCIIGSFSAENIVSGLSLDPSLVPLLICAIGYPNEEPQIVDIKNGDTTYYRDNGIHYVPKRNINDIIINNNFKEIKNEQSL